MNAEQLTTIGLTSEIIQGLDSALINDDVDDEDNYTPEELEAWVANKKAARAWLDAAWVALGNEPMERAIFAFQLAPV